MRFVLNPEPERQIPFESSQVAESTSEIEADWRNFSSSFIVVCPRLNMRSRTLIPPHLSLVFKAIINYESKHIYVIHG